MGVGGGDRALGLSRSKAAAGWELSNLPPAPTRLRPFAEASTQWWGWGMEEKGLERE